MQSAVVFVALMAAAASAHNVQLVGAPGSSVVAQQRLGGNYAYTVGQQPAYAYQAGYPYAAYNGAYNTPVVYTAGTVPAVSKVPATYTYQAAPVSTVVAGTPAATYKTVAGVSPVAYNALGYNNVVGYNGLGYNNVLGYNGLGYNGLGYNGVYNGQGYNGVYNGLGYNGYTTVA